MTQRFFSNRTKLRPGALRAVEAWAAEGNRRQDEWAQTMRDEGITLEAWMLEEQEGEYYLVSFMETDDYDKAIEVFSRSTHAIDEYHRQFLAENTVERTPLRVLNVIRAE